MTAWIVAMAAWLCAADSHNMIAFVQGADDHRQCVMLLDLDRDTLERAGRGQADGPPQWSPDGGKIAFSSRTDTGQLIFIYDLQNKSTQTLNHTLPWNSTPVWSPDGGKIACIAGAGRDARETVLMVHDVESGLETQWGTGSGLYSPAWMPNENLILALDPDQQLSFDGVDMMTVKDEWHTAGALVAAALVPDAARFSTEIVLITRTQSLPILPIVLPDSSRYAEYMPVINRQGDRVAYESNDGGDREIYMLGKRGVVDLSNHRAADWNPQWSHDGKTLVFESFRNGRRGVYRVFSDTALIVPVAASENYDCWAPAWSPKSEFIAYVSDKGGHTGLYRCTGEGEKHEQLTAPGHDEVSGAPLFNIFPAWRP